MHTPTVLTETTADTVFTLILMTARRALEMAEMVKAGKWTRSIGSDSYGVDVHHKTIGIWVWAVSALRWRAELTRVLA